MGKTDGFYANQIIELINRNLKKERIQIGRIDLMQNFSFFEVAEEQAPMVIKALNKASVNGRKVSVEVAGENNGKSDKGGRKRGKSTADAEERPVRGGRKKAATEEPAKKKAKPSREERGYTEARGPKKKTIG